MLMCKQNLVKFCPFILKILSGNEILTSIKGYNSVANVQKIVLYNPSLDLINVKLELMFMKHYAPNRCLYRKVAKLRTGFGSAEMSHLQNCSLKIYLKSVGGSGWGGGVRLGGGGGGQDGCE